VGVFRDCPKFSGTPISQERGKLQISSLAITFRGSIRIKAHEKYWKKGAWAYPGTVQIFWVPPIISGTGKATDFKFSQYFQRVHRNKSPLKILEKRSVGVSRDCPNFWEPPIISGTGKATDFKFRMHIYGLNRNRSPLKIREK